MIRNMHQISNLLLGLLGTQPGCYNQKYAAPNPCFLVHFWPYKVHFQTTFKISKRWAVVVTQLVERLLPTTEIRSSNPVISIFYLLSTLQTIITIFTNKCEKCPSRIRCQDLNPRPSENESPHITTRPGLPPLYFLFVGYANARCLSTRYLSSHEQGKETRFGRFSKVLGNKFCFISSPNISQLFGPLLKK